MPSYKLDLKIDESSLAFIRSAQLKITLSKPMDGFDPNVTWVVFDPFQGNTVEWTEEYGLYASANQSIVNGAAISKISEVMPATDAAYYNFMESANFSGPYVDGQPPGLNCYKAYNYMPTSNYQALTFGLEQKASITDRGVLFTSPINAAVVLSRMNVVFKPITKVYVWLQASYKSGTVITDVNGDATIVEFGDSVSSKTLSLDKNTGRFISANSDGSLLQRDTSVNFHKRIGVYQYIQSKGLYNDFIKAILSFRADQQIMPQKPHIIGLF